MVTIKLLLWILFIAAFVVWSVYNIRKGNRPFYLLENILKGVFFILYGAFIWDTQYEMFTVVLTLWCVTTYWLLFDISMGVILHTDPFYVGRNSGWIDRFHYVNTWTMIAYWTLKLIALFTAVATTINIYKH